MIQYIYEQIRPRARRHRRDRDLLSRPLGDPRGRQGVRPVRGHDRRAVVLDLGRRRRRGVEGCRHAHRPRSAEPRACSKIAALAREINGFPRHLSQHVGGFVITRSRLDEVMPIGNGAMPDRTFVEWDKDDLDALGILKIDVLGLGMLTCIRKALDLMGKHYPGALNTNSAVMPREGGRIQRLRQQIGCKCWIVRLRGR